MGTVSIRPELLEALDEITAGDASKRDELVNHTLAEFLVGRQIQAGMDEPDWHLPLVEEALASLGRGEAVERTMQDIIARADAE